MQSEENRKKLFEKVVLESSSSASGDNLKSEEGIAEPLSFNFRTPSLEKRGRKDIFTPEVLGSLNRGKISDRHAALIVASVISATGENLSKFTISCSSLQRYCIKYREDRSRYLKAEFQSNGKPS